MKFRDKSKILNCGNKCRNLILHWLQGLVGNREDVEAPAKKLPAIHSQLFSFPNSTTTLTRPVGFTKSPCVVNALVRRTYGLGQSIQ